MWDEAKDYCANLILGGVAGWRLPGRMELYTTVDLTKSNPAIDLTVFPNTPAKCFWSAAQSSIVSGTAWFVEFYYGGSIYDSKSRQCNVRCVR
jgi:hypothetical protein